MSPVASLIRTRRTSPWVKGNKSVLADVALTPGMHHQLAFQLQIE